MRSVEKTKIPVWRLILVILLSTLLLAVMLLVFWFKWIKRSSWLKRWPSVTLKDSAPPTSIMKSQIVRVSWNPPLSLKKYGLRRRESFASNRLRSFQSSPRARFGVSGNDQQFGFHRSVLVDARSGDDFNTFTQRPWSDLLENQTKDSFRASIRDLTDEESRRSSHTSYLTSFAPWPERPSFRTNVAEVGLPTPDSPAPLSPTTSLILAQNSLQTGLRPRSLQLLPQYATLPLPPKVYQLSTYREDLHSQRSLQKRKSLRVNWHQPPDDSRSSDRSPGSSFHTASGTSPDWLVHQKTQVGNASTKSGRSKIRRAEVVSIAEVDPELDDNRKLDDKSGADTSATVLFTDSGSSLSLFNSSAATTASSSTRGRRRTLDPPRPIGQSSSTKSGRSKLRRAEVVSITEVDPEVDPELDDNPEHDGKNEADTLATVLFTDSGSSLSRYNSSTATTSSSSTRGRRRTLDPPQEVGRENTSWLTDV